MRGGEGSIRLGRRLASHMTAPRRPTGRPAFWACTFLLACAAAGSACMGSDAQRSDPGNVPSATGGMPPAPQLELKFQDTPIQVLPREERRITVKVSPPSAYTVRFALLAGEAPGAATPLDAALDRSEVVSDASGIASVILTAPSAASDFSLRAQVGAIWTATAISVVPGALVSLAVRPSYLGHRVVSEAEWTATLTRSYGEAKAAAIVAALKRAYPNKSIRTLSYMCSGPGLNGLALRNNVTRMATMKHQQKAAPAYAWYFRWQSPMLEDAGAWHTAELAFCFDNAKRCEQGTGNTPEAQKLARTMATAWANFARTGNPSQPGLTWTPTDPAHGQTMVFDNHCRMVNDPEGEVRKILLG